MSWCVFGGFDLFHFVLKSPDVHLCQAEKSWYTTNSEGKFNSYLDNRYIVRFTSYKHAEDLREELVSVLGPESNGWKWIKRYNKAASHPTDFGLISLGKKLLDNLQVRQLGTLEYVNSLVLNLILNKTF